MPKIILAALLALILSSLACSRMPVAEPTTAEQNDFVIIPNDPDPSGIFTELENGNIVASDGTEYEHLAMEGLLEAFGSRTFLGKVKGEKPYNSHLMVSADRPSGLFSLEGYPNQDVLLRVYPDSEWYAFFRKTSLPALDRSIDNCVRFELIPGKYFEPGIEHMTCGEGVKGEEEIKAFLAEVRSQKSPEEAKLYDLVRKPDGLYENCHIYPGYGHFADEPFLAIPFHVTSYNDKAYSISLGDAAYVLPEKWYRALTEHK